ncbi:hypothetical protein ACFLQJ_00110 [Calditrichota bacterium]
MQVKKLKRYSIPMYPQGLFHPRRENTINKAVKAGTLSATLLALLQGCEEFPYFGKGVDGNMAYEPAMTEADARLVIEEVFTRNNIQIPDEITLVFSSASADSIELDLDGYNDSLKVGYEYNGENEYLCYDDTLNAEFESALNDSGYHIKISSTVAEDDDEYLENLMQTFIDSLKAHGVI